MNHDFLFDPGTPERASTARKVHIRRVYDILQLSLQRNDPDRARKAWVILTRCKEFDWKSMWTTGVHLINPQTSLDDVELNSTKIEFLRTLMLQHPDQKEFILRELVLRLIQSERFREALDELELYLPSFPFQDSPVLHIYAGLICLYMAQPTNASSVSFDPNSLREAQIHLERAKSLDPDNIVSQAFLEKIVALSQSSTGPMSSDHDSEDDEVITDAGGNHSKRVKR